MVIIETIFENSNGKIIHGDNLEVLDTLETESVDNCISDFPYAIEFMNKNWDSSKCWNQGEGAHGTFEGTGYSGKKRPAFYLNSNEDKIVFYDWCFERAKRLYSIIKNGGYVAIFGHPKTNHRMKCAFEDAGFKIVEEVDWIYLTGMPKNQDIAKLIDKSKTTKLLSEQWDGWKTSGLKPAHEPITIFQKPIDKNYVHNIEKYGCGAMNIDACRVPISKEDINMLNAKASKNPTTNYSDTDTRVYGKYAEDKASPANELGRFPANIILDEYTAQILDEQTGTTKSSGGSGDKSKGALGNSIYGTYKNEELAEHAGGLGDSGGGSRLFTVIKYNQKVSPKERLLPNGERNPHVTLKPVELIKWLIKLLTPIDGTTIDITAGSCTHAVACEQLNKDDGYNLKYIDMELMNTDDDPYCNVGKLRVEDVASDNNT